MSLVCSFFGPPGTSLFAKTAATTNKKAKTKQMRMTNKQQVYQVRNLSIV